MSEFKPRREDPPPSKSSTEKTPTTVIRDFLMAHPNEWFAIRDYDKQTQASVGCSYYRNKKFPGCEFVSRGKTVYGIYRPVK